MARNLRILAWMKTLAQSVTRSDVPALLAAEGPATGINTRMAETNVQEKASVGCLTAHHALGGVSDEEAQQQVPTLRADLRGREFANKSNK